MIPEWIPFRIALAYFTGACHISAGVAILTGFRARLAATLEAVMMASFVVLIHLTSLFSPKLPFWAPDIQLLWTLVFIALSLSGSAWLIASTIEDRATGGLT
jgi:uncharacterized membrane protein YphA (DoxX/SURF4 family)